MFCSRIVILKFRCNSKGPDFHWYRSLQMALDSLNSVICSFWRGFISAIVVKMLKEILVLFSSIFLLFLLFCFCFFFQKKPLFCLCVSKATFNQMDFSLKECKYNLKIPKCYSAWLLKHCFTDWSYSHKGKNFCFLSFESLGHERILSNVSSYPENTDIFERLLSH